MTQTRFCAVTNMRNHLVVERDTGRCLGGLATTFYRPMVFPLSTPRGRTVIQECPPDHPFHSGFFVGQSPVVMDGREANFWCTPPARMHDDHQARDRIGRMDAQPPQIEPHDSGVRFLIRSVWRDEHEQPILDELRTVDLYATGDATVCDMRSEKTAAYGPVTYPATKYGSIGIRVDPRLLPDLGGVVIGEAGRRGRADVVHEQDSAYVAYENTVGGRESAGVMISVLTDDVRGSWFIRDYGLALYNSTSQSEISTAQGESWSVQLRAVAYDGPLTEERARRWIDGSPTTR